MTRQLAARLIIDFAMTILLLCAFAYRITGDAAHEWIGVSLFVLFIAHNIINRHWWRGIFKGKYSTRRTIMTAVNIALTLTMAALIITGLLHSRTILAFLHFAGGMMLRQIHTTAAYWGLLFISIHAGLHWRAPKADSTMATKIVFRTLAVLIAAFGVWAFLDRDMFSKLFLGFSFDYWSEERPIILFFMEHLSIMGVYVFVTYYTFKLFGWFQQQKIRDNS